MLLNIGYNYAKKSTNDFWQCYIFHDVDHLPENDGNLYNCASQVRHMSVSVQKYGYKFRSWYYGGSVAVNRSHYELLNGFSNEFWGWGSEDDDLRHRIIYHHLKTERYIPDVAR